MIFPPSKNAPAGRRLALLLIAGTMALAMAAGLQLANLNETPTADRRPITGREWPTTPGNAVVCLWEDDKLCAVTMSVDDNIATQVPNWLQHAQEVGFAVTWFVITDRIGGANAGFDGTWALWRDVVAKGHDVQSHTRQHLHVTNASWPGIYEEYAGSRAAIESNIPGHVCDFLAYPGGSNSSYNDRNVAAQIYAGARGGAGSGFNRPWRIDYLTIRNGNFLLGSGPASSDLLSLFNANDVRYYRGWAAPLFHTVTSWDSVSHYFTFLRTYRDDIWAGRFSDVGKYGQQRDTSSLTVTENTPTRITFVVQDDMLDSRFDYPLTIKVRLPDSWQSVAADQAGTPRLARFVRHQGQPYALVRAVPDRGPVVISEAQANTPGPLYADWLESHILPADRSGLGAPTASPATDGVNNLLKHALGLSPREAGLQGRVRQEENTNGACALLVTRPYPRPSDIDYVIETSSDLRTWSTNSVSLATVGVQDGLETIRGSVMNSTPGEHQFLRLRTILDSATE
ncbi:MAG: polysaccharide deacetylase family protein [Terrimicrobiaceae bacterium]|nr:polysaccharide deacetylase family protein [Terrimicrobiaceae bacterium]